MTTRTVSNSDHVIDSRDVIARVEELQSKHDAVEEAKAERADMNNASAEELAEADEAIEDAEADFDEDEQAELATLKSLAEEAEGYSSDWSYGSTLIRESYFAEYCQEMLEDIGDLPKDLPSYIAIDWDATADNLRVDYTEVEFDGVTYLIR